jgi:hypothetical protein
MLVNEVGFIQGFRERFHSSFIWQKEDVEVCRIDKIVMSSPLVRSVLA